MRRLIERRGLQLAAVGVLALAGAGCGDDVADMGPDTAQTEPATEDTAAPAEDGDAADLFAERETLVGETVEFSAEVTEVVTDTAVEVAGDVGDPILVASLDPDAGPFEEGQELEISGDVLVFDEQQMLADYPYDDTGFYWDDAVWDDYDGEVMVLADRVGTTDGGTETDEG